MVQKPQHILLILTILLIQTYSQDPDPYVNVVNNLKAAIENTTGIFYNRAYQNLAYISDTYGPRLWGSQALEDVILFIYQRAQEDGFDNVRLEAVKNFTKWVRGNEELYMHEPRPVITPLKLIGLGGTVSGNVTAQVLVVTSYEDLAAKKDQAKGKIVVYNNEWTTYGETVKYRAGGASQASKYGAVGALVRSVTPDSVASPHTGIQYYNPAYPKIPVAAITTEDADMFARMQKRNQTIVLELIIENQEFPNTFSNNLVFEIQGTSKKQEILLMGGHIDSWDTGPQTGANDDAGGFITCYEAMRLLLQNGYRPKRTIRFIAWSGEEWGDPRNGAHSYFLAHKDELKNHIVAFEDDLGSTLLQGFGYSGKNANDTGSEIVKDVLNKYLSLIKAGTFSDDGEAVDTGPLREVGIPVMKNLINDTADHKFYFSYHHSAGDSMTMMNPQEMDSNVLGVAIMFYILADLENSIPLPDIKMEKVQELVQKIQKAKLGFA